MRILWIIVLGTMLILKTVFSYDIIGDIDESDGYQFPQQEVNTSISDYVYDMDGHEGIMYDDINTNYEAEKKDSFSDIVNKFNDASVQEGSEDPIYDDDLIFDFN